MGIVESRYIKKILGKSIQKISFVPEIFNITRHILNCISNCDEQYKKQSCEKVNQIS